MSVGLAQQRMCDRVIRRKGASATLTRPLVLTGSGGTAFSGSLALVGAHSAGASSITIDSSAVAGTVPIYTTVTISGTSYTTTAAAKFSANAVTLTVTPVLAANYANDTAVTLTAGSETVWACREELRLVDFEQRATQVQGEKVRYFISPKGTTRTPEDGDRLTFGSDVHKIYESCARGSTTTPAYFDVLAGDA